MRNIRPFILFLCLFCFSSLCFAGMTIYFKDGTATQVRKIQFNGEQADLYLMTGSMKTVPVSTLDLPSSGIFKPVGTYGGSDIGTGTAKSPGAGLSGASGEQNKLRTQWEDASETAVAAKNYGAIQEGDTVRIVSRSGSVVTVIHHDSGGNYKKVIIENSTFFDVFRSQKKPERVIADIPVAPAQREPVVPEEETPQAPAVPAPSDEVSKPAPVISEPAPITAEERSTKSPSMVLPAILSGAILFAIVGFAVVTMKKRSSISVDPARIAKRERELRHYHIPNWLKRGMTSNQLVELSLNQFFSDNPKALGLSLRILEGEPKSLVLAALMREGGKNPAQSEVIYENLKGTVDLARSLIEEVSHNTGAYPSDFKPPAGTAGAVAKAGLAARAATGPVEQVLIVNRPTSVTVCAILLMLAAISTAVFIFSDIPYSAEVRKAIGMPGLYFSVAFTIACAYGYWTMKRWGVLLYALEPLVRFFMGVPTGLIAVPVIIVVVGMIHLEEMTWK